MDINSKTTNKENIYNLVRELSKNNKDAVLIKASDDEKTKILKDYKIEATETKPIPENINTQFELAKEDQRIAHSLNQKIALVKRKRKYGVNEILVYHDDNWIVFDSDSKKWQKAELCPYDDISIIANEPKTLSSYLSVFMQNAGISTKYGIVKGKKNIASGERKYSEIFFHPEFVGDEVKDIVSDIKPKFDKEIELKHKFVDEKKEDLDRNQSTVDDLADINTRAFRKYRDNIIKDSEEASKELGESIRDNSGKIGFVAGIMTFMGMSGLLKDNQPKIYIQQDGKNTEVKKDNSWVQKLGIVVATSAAVGGLVWAAAKGRGGRSD